MGNKETKIANKDNGHDQPPTTSTSSTSAKSTTTTSLPNSATSTPSGASIQSPVIPTRTPKLNAPSTLLNDENIAKLSSNLPSDEYRTEWSLLYSSTKNGHSFNRLCSHITEKGSTLILIKDDGGHVFGGFADEVWKTKFPKFYGNERSFVFRLQPTIDVFRASGIDRNFQYLNEGTTTLYNGIGMGGIQHLFGWVIDDTFDCGHSKVSEDDDESGHGKSSTFGNPSLSHSKEFKCVYVEVWMVKERVLTEEEMEERAQQEARRKKRAGKSVLDAEGNADKVIAGYMGHNFSNFNEDIKQEAPKK
ncbi:hypothetical protein SAMD00019534_064250, partial [Acytostelium subglobosum LB1]|uniref:hypothetical protein n=1 Tax=Acytostelium subglobosum LB1 TaxID=1410327 RepID=UPI000644D2EB